MASDRQFLDWREPALPRAARWMLQRCAADGTSLADWTVVVAGRRAGRRLIEALLEETDASSIQPPRIVTAGQLPELLYQPSRAIADDLAMLMARMAALREAPAEHLTHLTPQRPDDEDIGAWTTLAQQINLVHETLAADGCSFADGARESHVQTERWAALVYVQTAYEATLDRMGLMDVHAARLEALANHTCHAEKPLLLLATADLNRVTRRMLEQDADKITALVHAPPETAMEDRFDAFGCIIPDKWTDQPLNLDPSHLIVVDRPRDMAHAVIRAIAAWQKTSDIALDDITIGLGDESHGPMIRRTLEMAGLPAHQPVGRPMTQAAPALLLDALAAFASSKQMADFAALARHADFDSVTPGALHVLDEYAAKSLQQHLLHRWVGAESKIEPVLQGLYDSAVALLPTNAGRPRPLCDWSDSIIAALERIYGQRPLARHKPQDAPAIETLERLGELLHQQADLDPNAPTTPRLTFAEAVRLTLSRLGGQLTAPDTADASIEMLGWLELQMDDAPLMLITSVNEGSIPQSQRGDTSGGLLPDSMRSRLGLADNALRYARDRMMLEAILASRGDRGQVVLFSARRDEQDNPLTPSRLTLACDLDKLPAWVERFYGRDDAATPPLQLMQAGKHSRFVIPVPRPMPTLTKLRVTAFRAYLACPYRFYLAYVERLETVDDRVVELDAMAFGTLAHEVLQAFGKEDIADSMDAAAISSFLADRLDGVITRSFSSEPRPAILIQAHMLRRRFEGFARWQAKWRREGWRIRPDLIERQLTTILDVDGEPFTITGTIDRIDEHGEFGYALLDYKTSDGGKTPEAAHRKADQWIDLQLPLYRDLAATRGITGMPQLGYINLPKKTAEAGLAKADWDAAALDSARQTAFEVIRKIRGGVFFPPAEPADFPDGLEAICMDDYDQRRSVIKQLMEARRG